VTKTIGEKKNEIFKEILTSIILKVKTLPRISLRKNVTHSLTF
jgi:hypothetical protein